MRILYALFVGWIWCFGMIVIMSKTNINISNDIQVLSTAIIMAGVLAGGDD